MKATRIAHTLFVLALSSIFLFGCFLGIISYRANYSSDTCPVDLDEYRELKRLAPKVHAYIQKEGRLPTKKEIFFLTEDKTIEASISGSRSDFNVLVTSGHDPKLQFEEREQALRMWFDGPYSHYTSIDDSITCHRR